MPASAPNGTAVVELLALYLRHATGYYGPGAELEAIKAALKIVREHYGTDAVADFGPKKLAAVREAFIGKGWARTYINRQVGKVVRAFRWAVGEEIIPSAVYLSLKSLAPLRRGHCEAPESAPRLPANPKHVAATMPFLSPHVVCDRRPHALHRHAAGGSLPDDAGEDRPHRPGLDLPTRRTQERPPGARLRSVTREGRPGDHRRAPSPDISPVLLGVEWRGG